MSVGYTASGSGHVAAVERFFDDPFRYLGKDHLVRIRARIVASLLAPLPSASVLDAGCGDGSVSLPLLEFGNRVAFLDPSKKMLELARTRVPERHSSDAEFLAMLLEDLPPHRVFDVVLAMGLLAHVDSVEKAFARIVAHCRSGGTIIIQLTDCDSLLGRLNLGYCNLRERIAASFGYRLNRLSTSGLESLARGFGCRFVLRQRYSLLMPGMTRLPNRLLYAKGVASLYWPLKLLGGESILVFQKAT